MAPKKQTDLKLLKKVMLDKVKVFMAICKAYALRVFVTETLRTAERQAYLWSVGRTISITSKKVTWTKVSMHQSGLAVDRAFVGTMYKGDRDAFRHFAKHCGLTKIIQEQCHTQDNCYTVEEVMARNSRLWESSEGDVSYRKLLHKINDEFRKLGYK